MSQFQMFRLFADICRPKTTRNFKMQMNHQMWFSNCTQNSHWFVLVRVCRNRIRSIENWKSMEKNSPENVCCQLNNFRLMKQIPNYRCIEKEANQRCSFFLWFHFDFCLCHTLSGAHSFSLFIFISRRPFSFCFWFVVDFLLAWFIAWNSLNIFDDCNDLLIPFARSFIRFICSFDRWIAMRKVE